MPNHRTRTERTDDSVHLSRRRLLRTAGAGGVLLLAAGSATANGNGGQCIVHEDLYYPDETFVIRAVPDSECDNPTPDGSCRDDSLLFQCRGQGGPFPPGKDGGIPFPFWNFEYEGGPRAEERLKLYTRDNSIETDITYRWSRKEKDCPETPGYFQVGFVADNG